MLGIADSKDVLALLSIVSVFCLADKNEFQDRSEPFKSYAGHQLLRVYSSNPKDFEKLQSIEQEHSNKIDFWQRPTFSKRNVDLLVAPEDGEAVKKMMREAGLEMAVVSNDIQKFIDEEFEQRSDNAVSKRSSHINTLHQYQSYSWMMEWLEDKSEKCDYCNVIDIGKSSEGRLLKVLEISKSKTRKPAIFIDAGFHAREWIGPITALNFIEALTNETDPVMSFLTSEFVWYILPVANPDGYVYTWTKDRLWRKTRSRHGSKDCFGTDLNRNWDFHWGEEGTSRNPCADNHCGPRPFSEPESRAMADFILERSSDMIMYLTLHSYGQVILTPWGYTTDVPHDFYDLLIRGTDAAEAMRKATGVKYAVGASGRMLYLASGASDDWVKGVAKVKYSFTLELRDLGDRGFLLPDTQIPDTSLEVTKGIAKMSLDVLNELRTYGSKYVVVFHEEKNDKFLETPSKSLMNNKEVVEVEKLNIAKNKKLKQNHVSEDLLESHENKELIQENVEDQFNNDFKYEINKDNVHLEGKLNAGNNLNNVKGGVNVEIIKEDDDLEFGNTNNAEDDTNNENNANKAKVNKDRLNKENINKENAGKAEEERLEMAANKKLKELLEEKLKTQRLEQYVVMKRLQDEMKKQDLWYKQKSFEDTLANELGLDLRYHKRRFI